MLTNFLANKKTIETIEHFILHENYEQNQKELCDILHTYPKKMKSILHTLLKYNIIKETRHIARSIFYIVNKQSEFFMPLRILSQKVALYSYVEEGI